MLSSAQEKLEDVYNHCSPGGVLVITEEPGGRSRAWGRWILIGFMVLFLALGPLAVAANADSTYTVQAGDTLSSIAARYGTTVDAIVTANALPSRSTIYAGQVLKIPSP